LHFQQAWSMKVAVPEPELVPQLLCEQVFAAARLA
jgi:hypothetical protein